MTNDNIPLIEGEEMWAQEAIDTSYRKNGRYCVSYYFGTGNMVSYKWFDTFSEASQFSLTIKSGDVIEIKWYSNES
jgi:hypothetical protein